MPEDGSDHLPPPATPPAAGTQLLNDYLQHIQEFKRMKPAIAVDGQGRHAWIRMKTPWLQGHMDVQLFDSGILAASSRGRLLVPYTSPYEEKHYTPPVALTLKMHGAFDWTDLRGREFQTPGDNELWFQSGVMDWRHSTLRAGDWSEFRLSMQTSLVERWLADGMLHDQARRLLEQCLQPRGQGIMQVHPMQADMSATMRQAHALMTGLAPMQTMPLAEQLQLEGQVLSLLGQWLALPPTPARRRQDRWRRMVDDAIDIIHSEYGTELSISRLARRVGTNECYLKQGFHERTGIGIATYLRQQRMKVALALLEEGRMSVREVAHYVGYRSLGHFSQAFRAVHGYLPSTVQRPSASPRPSRPSATQPADVPAGKEADQPEAGAALAPRTRPTGR